MRHGVAIFQELSYMRQSVFRPPWPHTDHPDLAGRIRPRPLPHNAYRSAGSCASATGMQPRSATGVEQACAGPSTTAGACGADVAASWLCGLALDVAWPPRVLRCGRLAARLELIRRAPRTGWAQIPGLGTAGQFCPRLRERQAAGLVVQLRRNGYAVPAGWVIRCVVLVAAAQGCANVREIAS